MNPLEITDFSKFKTGLKPLFEVLKNASDEGKPVSYTHLDVYKRQLLEDIKAEFAEVNAMMEAREAKEPEDEASEAYDKWIEECEQLAIESESLMTLIDYKMTQGL